MLPVFAKRGERRARLIRAEQERRARIAAGHPRTEDTTEPVPGEEEEADDSEVEEEGEDDGEEVGEEVGEGEEESEAAPSSHASAPAPLAPVTQTGGGAYRGGLALARRWRLKHDARLSEGGVKRSMGGATASVITACSSFSPR
jgi:hypothetical protein